MTLGFAKERALTRVVISNGSPIPLASSIQKVKTSLLPSAHSPRSYSLPGESAHSLSVLSSLGLGKAPISTRAVVPSTALWKESLPLLNGLYPILFFSIFSLSISFWLPASVVGLLCFFTFPTKGRMFAGSCYISADSSF